MYIYVQFSTDSLFSGTLPRDMECMDVPANVARYGNLVRERLQAEYSDAEIKVEHGDQTRYEIDGDGSDDETFWIRECVERVYNEFGWYVYKAEKPDYRYWQHKRSGDVIAVRLVNGHLTGFYGPFSPSGKEREDDLLNYRYDDDLDRIGNLRLHYDEYAPYRPWDADEAKQVAAVQSQIDALKRIKDLLDNEPAEGAPGCDAWWRELRAASAALVAALGKEES